MGTDFLNVISTDYVVVCFRTSFDTQKYLDLRRRHIDVTPEKLLLAVARLLPVHRPEPCAQPVGSPVSRALQYLYTHIRVSA